MDPLLKYEIPILHPLLVHFPIALILFGTAAVIAWAVLARPFWYRVSVLLYGGAAVSALAAYLTGEDAEQASEDVPIVDEIVHLHEDLAIYTLAATVMTLVALVVVQPHLLSGRDPVGRGPAPAIRWAVATLAIAAAVLVAWTSHLGGIMVFGVPR